MSIFKYLVSISLITLLAASSIKAENSNVKEFLLDEYENNSVLSVPKNSSFNIKLKGNASTGYIWILKNYSEVSKNNILDLSKIKENGSGDYVQNDSPKGYVGVPGKFVFEFKTFENLSDSQELVFVYRRPWLDEEEVEENNIKKVSIKVGSDDL